MRYKPACLELHLLRTQVRSRSGISAEEKGKQGLWHLLRSKIIISESPKSHSYWFLKGSFAFSSWGHRLPGWRTVKRCHISTWRGKLPRPNVLKQTVNAKSDLYAHIQVRTGRSESSVSKSDLKMQLIKQGFTQSRIIPGCIHWMSPFSTRKPKEVDRGTQIILLGATALLLEGRT